MAVTSPTSASPSLSLLEWDEGAVHSWLTHIGLPQYEEPIYGEPPLQADHPSDSILTGRRARDHWRCLGGDGALVSHRHWDDEYWTSAVPPSGCLGAEARTRLGTRGRRLASAR